MSNTTLSFLKTLYRLIEPNPDDSISMYDVGAEMDLDRDASNQTAQELMAEGLVEVRTLAGAIGITPKGLTLLETETETAADDDVCLGTKGVASSGVRTILKKLVIDLENVSKKWNLHEDDQAVLLADLETLKAQMSSPKPKNTILRATVESLHALLINFDQDDSSIERLAGLLD